MNHELAGVLCIAFIVVCIIVCVRMTIRSDERISEARRKAEVYDKWENSVDGVLNRLGKLEAWKADFR